MYKDKKTTNDIKKANTRFLANKIASKIKVDEFCIF